MLFELKAELSKEDILERVSSFDIFQMYCKNFEEVGKHFCSEFRIDKTPSCIIDEIRGDLMYSDFGYGLHIRAVDYVKLKFNLDFKDALEKIAEDFNLYKDYGNEKINKNNININNNNN